MGDLLAQAIDELYGLDPADFTDRRNELAAAARQAGASDEAKQIAALRRPTRAAWVLNQLARTDPDLASDFARLGAQLLEAHEALDGGQIRELTRQRRMLIDQTAAQAFASAGIGLPTAALRDEVTATLGAILAVPETALRFAAGSLVTAEEQQGFGPAGAVLTSVPNPDSTRSVKPPESAADRRRQAAIDKATAALAEAELAHQSAAEVAAQAAADVRQRTDQLADARRREDDARLDARHAELQLEKARTAIERARER